MKKRRVFLPLFLFLLLFTIPTSCKYYAYGLEEFFYRENTLDKRIDTLTELNETQTPQGRNFSKKNTGTIRVRKT